MFLYCSPARIKKSFEAVDCGLHVMLNGGKRFLAHAHVGRSVHSFSLRV